ncbi:MAG: VOC family protein [Flavobacteriales bacterium]|nr:VOC family protein [Flavobacteriales bacterium]
MNSMYRLTPVLFLMLVVACNTPTEPSVRNNEAASKAVVVADTTPKVTGIGGIFFFCDNPKQTREWYAKNLGMQMNDWGSSSFESRDMSNPEVINSLQWTPFKSGNLYFAPSEKAFMINYRVQNIETLIDRLLQNGVTIVDSLEHYEYGKFIHVMDPEGNKIELWEPS